jgi:ABC-type tungstate transport system permease subunit
MSTTGNAQEHFTTILQHRVKFWLRGENAPTELDEASIEHITRLIENDYREGELDVVDGDNEFRGWWQLDFS